jgi:four helix bundle protein
MSLADDLQQRTHAFSVRLLKFVRKLDRDLARDTIVRQLVRSGTGIGANHRASRRARSRAEFIARLGIVVEEADETEEWLALLRDADLCAGTELHWLSREANELRRIFAASLRTARGRVVNQVTKSHPHILTSSHPHILTCRRHRLRFLTVILIGVPTKPNSSLSLLVRKRW